MGGELIVIRPFEPGDVEAAADLEALSQPQPWSAGVFVDELAAPDRIYLVAEDGDLVGFGGVMMVADEAHLTNLLVISPRRGQGIGRRLLLALIEEAVSTGARHLTLEVRVDNQAARRLYASVGMLPVGVRPGYYGDTDALILWAHDIDSPDYRDRILREGAGR